MKYTTHSNLSQKKNKNIHFVLFLDESGSMYGQPWQDLINAVKNALEKMKGIFSKNSNNKVSIIGFNCSARIIY
jgi:uncharacterized protein YegL